MKVAATHLRAADGALIDVCSTVPLPGKVLTASSPTEADWQYPPRPSLKQLVPPCLSGPGSVLAASNDGSPQWTRPGDYVPCDGRRIGCVLTCRSAGDIAWLPPVTTASKLQCGASVFDLTAASSPKRGQVFTATSAWTVGWRDGGVASSFAPANGDGVVHFPHRAPRPCEVLVASGAGTLDWLPIPPTALVPRGGDDYQVLMCVNGTPAWRTLHFPPPVVKRPGDRRFAGDLYHDEDGTVKVALQGANE